MTTAGAWQLKAPAFGWDDDTTLCADHMSPHLRVFVVEFGVTAGQQAFFGRARANGAAIVGKSTDEIEAAPDGADDPPHRCDWRDD
jgi:hypothetical protein